jgi:hypothetical protein
MIMATTIASDLSAADLDVNSSGRYVRDWMYFYFDSMGDEVFDAIADKYETLLIAAGAKLDSVDDSDSLDAFEDQMSIDQRFAMWQELLAFAKTIHV